MVLKPVLWSRSQWSQNYLGPGAGDEIKFLIIIFGSQFGGCYNEDKIISTSISIDYSTTAGILEQFKVPIYSCSWSWSRSQNYDPSRSRSRK